MHILPIGPRDVLFTKLIYPMSLTDTQEKQVSKALIKKFIISPTPKALGQFIQVLLQHEQCFFVRLQHNVYFLFSHVISPGSL